MFVPPPAFTIGALTAADTSESTLTAADAAGAGIAGLLDEAATAILDEAGAVLDEALGGVLTAAVASSTLTAAVAGR